jgi:predicted lipoprotein with Yx(FWY)xxD motif
MFRVNGRAWAASLVAGATLIALVAGACGDDDDEEDGDPTSAANTPAVSGSPTSASAETPDAPTQGSGGAPTEAAPSGEGATVEAGTASLVDSRGFTLYIFANDTAGSGTSACTGGCATAWPPLTVTGGATAGEGVAGELGSITRDDGSTQVTYNGLPLYFFASDTAPGDTNGAAIPNWSLAQP